jgi:formiminotetrahydrofolate cyclodeaminase
MDKIEELMNKIFHNYRAPKSEEYKQGVRAALEQKITGQLIQCPYEFGTASRDAFSSGVVEGIDVCKLL